MKKAKANHDVVTQVSHSNTRPSSAESLRPNSGNLKMPDRFTSVSPELDTPVMLNHEEIMKRARAIWIQRGRLEGRDKADWYEAEAQLRNERFSESSLK
jgi:hypothetical protein